MKCLFLPHNSQEILLFCLNNNCKKAQACQECIQKFHIQHIHDCFKFYEMEFILSNELEKINYLANNHIQSFKIHAEQIQKMIKQAIEQIKKNTQLYINPKEIDNIISITKQCYHHQIQHQILSFILQNFKNQPEIMSELLNKFEQTFSQNTLEYQQKRLVQQGYRLFEQKNFNESFIYFNNAHYLKYSEANFIKTYCLVLFLTNRQEQAKQLIINQKEIFYNNIDLTLFYGSFLYLEKDDEFKKFNYFLRDLTGDYQTEQANLLLQMLKFEESLEIVNKVLKKNPKNERAIEIKVEVFLKQGKYGDAEQFIETGEKVNPKEFLTAKFICIIYDREHFDSYSQQLLGEDLKQLAQQFTNHLVKYEEMQAQEFKKMEEEFQKPGSGSQTDRNLLILFRELQTRVEKGHNTKHTRFIKMAQRFGDNDFESAHIILDELIIDLPACRCLYFFKSRCFQQQLNCSKSLEFARIAMYLDEEESLYTKNYAYSLVLDNKLEKALKILDESKLKNEYDILQLKGQILYQKKQFMEALICFEQMEKQQPKKSEPKIMIYKTKQQINKNNNVQNDGDIELMKKEKFFGKNMTDLNNYMKILFTLKFDQLLKSLKGKDFMLFFMD